MKRLFAQQSFSLQRLDQTCNLLGLEISDLVALMNERLEFLTELTPEQEETLLADPKLLLMTYLLINGWPLAEIVATWRKNGPVQEFFEQEVQHEFSRRTVRWPWRAASFRRRLAVANVPGANAASDRSISARVR